MTKKELEEKVKRLEAEVELLKLKLDILEKYPTSEPFKQPQPWPYIPSTLPDRYDITYPFPPKIWYNTKTDDKM